MDRLLQDRVNSRKISATLKPRRSAKVLINRYESMVNTPQNTPTKSEKSPLRESIRNMLSVFKKTKGDAKLKHDLNLSVVAADPFTVPDLPPKATQVGQSGSLLYLSHIDASSTLPVWTDCNAVLQDDRIVITWNTSFGNPCTNYIPLLNLTDVRSLALRDLEPNERGLLPQTEDVPGFRVFELLFEGKAREKFATTSVQARASWVSAIWDAVLPAQERSGIIEAVEVEDRAPVSKFNEKENADPTSHIERSLPALPKDKTPIPTTIPITPPPSFRTCNVKSSPARTRTNLFISTPQASRASPSTTRSSQTRSSSITNLGQLSVVKQRLAQIERTNSNTGSQFSSTSQSSSRGAKRMSTTPTLLLESRYTKSIIASSGEADSILDEYMDNILLPPPAEMTSVSDEGYCSPQSPVRSALYRLSEKPHSAKFSSSTEREPASFVPQEIDDLSVAPFLSSPAKVEQSSNSLSPLVELLQGHAARCYDQSANLSEQIVALQHDVHNIPRSLAAGPETKDKHLPVLNSVQNAVKQLEERAEKAAEGNNRINYKLESLRSQIQQDTAAEAKTGEEVKHMLAGLQQRLGGDLPEILKRLAQIKESVKPASERMVLNNVNTKAAGELQDSHAEMHAKLDALSRLLEQQKIAGGSDRDELLAAELKTVMTLLKSEESQRIVQSQQQADSVRYLNELNLWLEAFVNNGTSHIQTLSVGVEQLCRELGIDSSAESSTLLRDVRQFLAETRIRDQNAVALQGSLNQLLAVMKNEPHKASPFTPESVVEMIQHQHQHQEGLVKNLTSQISSEIRGEQLRFVEAMKEATQINVQAHVEQFKTELRREVVNMTREVNHLQRERQMVENQISELVAFHRKQKEIQAPHHSGHPSGHGPPVTVTVTHTPPQSYNQAAYPPRLQYPRV